MSTPPTPDDALATAQAAEWPRIVTLRYPIAWGSSSIASLTFRRGCAGDMKNIKITSDGVDANSLMLIASRQCGQPTQVIEKLDVDDAAEVMAIALGFYGQYLAGGKTP